MIGHQRDILATMGIEIWIPQDAVCQEHQPALWRDQAAPELISEILLAQAPIQNQKHEPIVELLALEPVVEEQVQPAVVVSKVHIPTDVVQNLVHVEPFTLQALSTPYCTIILEVSDMTEAQQQLWANIQHAVAGEFSELRWPFPWINVADGRGVEVYVQGFVDALSVDKNVISLGMIKQISHENIIQLASLQEMLDQPILKRRLWQFMQNRG